MSGILLNIGAVCAFVALIGRLSNTNAFWPGPIVLIGIVALIAGGALS